MSTWNIIDDLISQISGSVYGLMPATTSSDFCKLQCLKASSQMSVTIVEIL